MWGIPGVDAVLGMMPPRDLRTKMIIEIGKEYTSTKGETRVPLEIYGGKVFYRYQIAGEDRWYGNSRDVSNFLEWMKKPTKKTMLYRHYYGPKKGACSQETILTTEEYQKKLRSEYPIWRTEEIGMVEVESEMSR